MAVSKETTNVKVEENGPTVVPLDPPSSTVNKTRDPVKLVFELLYVLIIFIPYIVWTCVENIFLAQRKSVKGKVVLVSFRKIFQ